jgi:excisionase family DNA binding protein
MEPISPAGPFWLTREEPAKKRRNILGPKWDNFDSFTVEQAAEILGLSRASAYAAVVRGDLQAARLGRRWIVGRPALERLLGAEARV